MKPKTVVSLEKKKLKPGHPSNTGSLEPKSKRGILKQEVECITSARQQQSSFNRNKHKRKARLGCSDYTGVPSHVRTFSLRVKHHQDTDNLLSGRIISEMDEVIGYTSSSTTDLHGDELSSWKLNLNS